MYLVSCSLHNILYPEHCCIHTQLFESSYHPSQDCTDGEIIEMGVIADLEKTSTEVQSSQDPKNQVLISGIFNNSLFSMGINDPKNNTI